MYDPTQGRFLSEDPLGFEAGDANVYRYVGNAVTSRVDPSGLFEIEANHDTHTITLTVDVFYDFQKSITSINWSPFSVEYNDWTLNEKHRLKTTFVSTVEGLWNADEFYLSVKNRKTTLGERLRGSPECTRCGFDANAYALKLEIREWFDPKTADVVMHVLAWETYRNPDLSPPVTVPFYQSYTSGNQMYITEDDVYSYAPVDTHHSPPFTSYNAVAAHEFGHAIGLSHPGIGQTPPSEDRGRIYNGGESSWEYDQDYESLMGIGSEMRSTYFQKWISEIRKKYSVDCPIEIHSTEGYHPSTIIHK